MKNNDLIVTLLASMYGGVLASMLVMLVYQDHPTIRIHHIIILTILWYLVLRWVNKQVK